MAHKALGRDLGDLLSRARPARLVARAAAPTPPLTTEPAPSTQPPAAALELPLSLPSAATPPLPAAEANARPDVPPSAIQSPQARQRRPFSPERPPATPSPSEPPPGPATTFYVLLGLDLILLGAAGLLAFTDLVERPLSLILAAIAVLAGAACSVFAFLLRPSGPPRPQESKVRVHLRRI